MSKRVKEEERIENIIRGFLKLPENRRCINCNSLGPQYVCTTFWTFVCTNCSGLHREFTHRVKSVSMAKFTAEEVCALQVGGNEKAREIYFKNWDPKCNSFPDTSNLQRLREFIKHVYVDRIYTGEKSSGKNSMLKMGPKDDFDKRRSLGRSSQRRPDEFYEQHSFERSSQNFRNDLFERRCSERFSKGANYDLFECHSFERSSPSARNTDENFRYMDNRRIPQYKQEMVTRGSAYRNRPARFEVVDDRFRDGNPKGGRWKENSERRSIDSQRGGEMKDSFGVHPIKDFSRENSPQSNVDKTQKANDREVADGSVQNQNSASSGNPVSVDETLHEQGEAKSNSLIDFETNPAPPDNAAATQKQLVVSASDDGKSVAQPSTTEKVYNTQSVNSVETLLLELSVPAVAHADVVSEIPATNGLGSAAPVKSSNDGNAAAAVPIANSPLLPSNNGSSMAYPVGNITVLPNTAAHAGSLHQNEDQPTLPSARNEIALEQNQDHLFATPVVTNQWTASSASNSQAALLSMSSEQSSQAFSRQAQDTVPEDGTESSGIKELPKNLFTSNYSSYPTKVSNWQCYPSHGMGYSGQYLSNPMTMPTFPSLGVSKNPFNTSDGDAQVQSAMFPSMSSLQGALPNASASMGFPPSLSPSVSGHSSVLPSNGMINPGVYMGRQQLPTNMEISRSQEVSSFSSGDDAFASINPIQHRVGRYSVATPPNSFPSAGGNPFG